MDYKKLFTAIIVVIVLMIVCCTARDCQKPICASFNLNNYSCGSNADDADDADDKNSDGKEAFESAPYEDLNPEEYRPGVRDEHTNNTDIAENMAWQDGIQVLGLEQSVVDSHRSFCKDSARSTTVASNVPTRSYDQDINPWVGLRRPDYCGVRIGDTARVVPSEYCDQLPQATRYML